MQLLWQQSVTLLIICGVAANTLHDPHIAMASSNVRTFASALGILPRLLMAHSTATMALAAPPIISALWLIRSPIASNVAFATLTFPAVLIANRLHRIAHTCVVAAILA